MLSLAAIALATLVSEDLTCIAAGVLIAQGKLSFLAGTAACLAGIFAGDLLLFLTGRLAGRAALRWRAVGRFATPQSVERASSWLSERGLAVILLSRFTPGLRLTTYFTAGLLRTRFWRFASMFLFASVIWTPLLVGSTVVFGEQALKLAFARGGDAFVIFSGVFVAALLARRLAQLLFHDRRRRRLVGFLKRKVRWEFWPAWAIYFPVAPYIAWLALKHRSLTLFTAANPGIPSGGFVGESKSAILDHLSRAEGVVARYAMIPAALETYARIRRAHEFLDESGLSFPVVLKPDAGERGSGVSIIRGEAELQSYLKSAERDTIIQEYVDGVEFGVVYYRYPGETKGSVPSITEKRFPEVAGDGRSTLAELILRDRRAVCLADIYLSGSRRPPGDVPAPGEAVRLVELGSHCRGAVFLNGTHLRTHALEGAIDRISQCHPGFFFGRYDVRAASMRDFQEGCFRVIELNGVSAEATHVYDPAVSLIEAYRVMFRHWRIAFEIGVRNRGRGAAPMPASELARLIWSRWRTTRRGVPVAAGRAMQETG